MKLIVTAITNYDPLLRLGQCAPYSENAINHLDARISKYREIDLVESAGSPSDPGDLDRWTPPPR